MSVDATQLRSVVERIASERPDFVYKQPDHNGCRYTHEDGSPGCLIGQGLHELGYVIAWDSGMNIGTTVLGLAARGVITGLNIDVDWLDTVQLAQDRTRPWGECIKIANGEMDWYDE